MSLFAELKNQLQKDVKLIELFVQILTREKDALDDYKIDQLEQILVEKSAALENLQESQKIRDNLQEKMGFTPGYKGLKDIFSDYEDKNTTIKLQQQLEQLLNKVKELTNKNAKSINIGLSQVSHIVELLKGEQNLYSNQPTTSPSVSSNVISKA